MLFQCVQGSSDANRKISSHKLAVILRAIYSCKIEYEISLLHSIHQAFSLGVSISNSYIPPTSTACTLSFPSRIFLSASTRFFSHKPRRSCYQYIHMYLLIMFFSIPCSRNALQIRLLPHLIY